MLAVLLYSAVGADQNPQGIPGNWPFQVIELADGEAAPSSDWMVLSKEDYQAWVDGHQAEYSTWATTFAAANAQAASIAYVKNKIVNAMAFGRDVMAEYGAQNVVAGYSLAQIQQIIIATSEVQAAIITGSLNVALDALSRVPVDGTLITTDKITFFRNKFQDFLGLPHT